jgi:hypothetical protein
LRQYPTDDAVGDTYAHDISSFELRNEGHYFSSSARNDFYHTCIGQDVCIFTPAGGAPMFRETWRFDKTLARTQRRCESHVFVDAPD